MQCTVHMYSRPLVHISMPIFRCQSAIHFFRMNFAGNKLQRLVVVVSEFKKRVAEYCDPSRVRFFACGPVVIDQRV